MGQIKVLDQNTINMIAAGEVIERPASVVKELVENSIDAGATEIAIYVEDGGKALIRVIDNGGGMDAQDLSVAFEAHATSKLKSSADLLNISTMGFRGEALASIASVAKVTVTSRTQESIVDSTGSPLAGNKIEIDCGTKGQIQPCSANVGTIIEIRNLFYKLPARKKFLKTANTEITHIVEQFIRIVLANTNITFSLFHNDRQLYKLNTGANVKERIAKLFSADLADSLLHIESTEKNMHVSAFVCKPENGRANTKFQYFFLNGRFIRDKFLSAAVRDAYRGIIEPDKFPVVFIFFTLPADEFDVNVHPTKIEVRFDNANLIYSQVLGLIREKMLAMDLDVTATLPQDKSIYPQSQGITGAIAGFFNAAKQSSSQPRFNFSDFAKKSDFTATQHRDNFYSEPAAVQKLPETEYFQIHDSYIIVQTDEGFLIIDQHALHERIIYEDLCRRLASDAGSKLESQKLLIPETFEVNPTRQDALNKAENILDKLGIVVEPFGPGLWAVQSFPTLLAKVNPVDFITDLLDILDATDGKLDTERLLHKILDMTACKAAVKAGQKLNQVEMHQLLADKEAIERASRCPHGRPTAIKFSLAELEKQFKRT
ncbi:MAG: DNA mismatch repair endonuclease MutL [Planctomycetaceae bacterium]|nr:DNA mismatch repair endonuclease MutL [Planctomycetaceae bacterium]